MSNAMSNQPASLAETWQAHRRQHPEQRIRDAAAQLGVSEGQLVACGCGESATRLRPDMPALLGALPSLGRVMALTRNDNAVIEKNGRYAEISIRGPMGLVLAGAIDLRLFMTHWHHAFAVTEPGRHGARRSLQVFDADGTAVHKVYLLSDSDAAAFDALLRDFRADDQGTELAVTPAPARAAERPDAEIDAAGLRAAWSQLKDTHDFYGLLGRFKVSRTQALRLAAPDMVSRAKPASHRTVLESAAKSGLSIMVFVGSPGCIEIHTGPVHKVFETNGWFNVMDEDFNLHLREAGVATSWVVRKPTTDGLVTALELYDAAGELIAQFFGERKPGKPELPGWRELAETLPA